jgi:hypothetical protein
VQVDEEKTQHPKADERQGHRTLAQGRAQWQARRSIRPCAPLPGLQGHLKFTAAPAIEKTPGTLEVLGTGQAQHLCSALLGDAMADALLPQQGAQGAEVILQTRAVEFRFTHVS